MARWIKSGLLAEKIADYADNHGFEGIPFQAQTGTYYVSIQNDEGNVIAKIRISNHAQRYGCSLDISPDSGNTLKDAYNLIKSL